MAVAAPVSRGPVFLIGSPRSGTTIVGLALAEHPAFWVSGEFHLFGSLYTRIDLEGVVRRELAFPGLLAQEHVTAPEVWHALGSGIRQLVEQRAGGRRWLDQTPGNVFTAEGLIKMYPDARFVHLLRDGREVVRSMLGFHNAQAPEVRAAVKKAGYLPAWSRRFDLACREWRAGVRAGLDFVEAHPDRATTFRYERLVSDPDGFFAELIAFTGEAPNDAPARYAQTTRVNSSFPDGVAPEPWNRLQELVFTTICGPTMRRAGFA